MLILGIESTAHTFGIGIVETDKKEILFNEKVVFSQEEGMDPRKLSEFHVANFQDVLQKAKNFLTDINKDFNDLDLISFSRGPGQGNALKIGNLVAKTLALRYNIKIVGINHIKSHLEIGKMWTGFTNPMFINITGVNSQVVAQDDKGVYRVYGETEDRGLGNLFDAVAREFNLGFPGGPVIEKRAQNAKRFLKIPYTIKGMNVSFAGLYSNIVQKKESFKNKKPLELIDGSFYTYESEDELIDDICFSLQEVVFAMIQEIAERAIAYTNKEELVLVGGVAANERFVEMTKEMCNLRGVKYDALPLNLCMDNGAMIAWMGYVDYNKASKDISDLQPLPYITVEDTNC